MPDEVPPFTRSLMSCDDGTSVTLPNGNRFIRKLPNERPLGYLHKLFPPLPSADRDKLCATLGRRLPPQFEDFLAWSNGATLFDNSFHLFGFQDGRALSRSSELEAQAALNIIFENETYSCLCPRQWSKGWTRIGSVAGWDSLYFVDGHPSAECVVTDGSGGQRSYPSFNSCVEQIVTRLTACFSCEGLIDPTGTELEAALKSLIYEN